MPDVKIHLFGQFQLLVNGDEVPNSQWRGQIPRTLIQYLATRYDGQASSDELIETLWGHLPAERARKNLIVVVSRLRAAFAGLAADAEPSALLPYTGTGYRLPAGTWTDLGALHQQVHDIRHLQAQDPAAALARLDQIAWPEPDLLLPEQPYADWAIAARERAHQDIITLRLIQADLLLWAGRARLALGSLRAVLEKEPVREGAARLAMQVAVDLGDRVAALDIFDRCRRALAEELGVDPMPETLAVHARTLQADTVAAAAQPPARPNGEHGSDAAPQLRPHAVTNLPAPPTSFIGRQAEMAAVKARFPGTRLLTLTGAGGAGKTRLALQVAADLLPVRPDGVWLVELASLTHPELVSEVVAATLGLHEHPQRSPLAVLVDHLQSKQMLLVLDNCEHLVDACAAFADTLLRGCPDLWILATSREALAIAGESLWPVPPLSQPAPGRQLPLDRIREYDAIHLFVDRAAAMVPDFTVTAENAAPIARICRRLDGMPLAIELAAALVKILSVEEIDARLHERFRLLTTGNRTAAPRQKTLRGAVDWSHELLPGAEQMLWRRLAVFAGGFTLAAAEAVCSDGLLLPSQVLELLSQLVDKSLVVAEESGGERRFRLLETIREYGLEKLREAGEEAAVRERHCDWCLELAEAVAAQQWEAQWVAGYERLEREHDNLRAALEWSPPAQAVRLAWALLYFWDIRGHVQEGRQRVAALLAPTDPPLSPAVRAAALTLSGFLAAAHLDYSAAIPPAEQALALWRELGDRKGVARCLLVLGQAEHHSGAAERAVPLLEEGVGLLRTVEDGHFLRHGLYFLAEALVSLGDYPRARAMHEESLALRRRVNDWNLAHPLIRLARIAALEGDQARAAALVRESAHLWVGRFPRGIAKCLEDVAFVALSGGMAERAVCLVGAAVAIRSSLGLTEVLSRPADRQQVLSLARRQLSEQAFAAAWAHGQSLSLERALAYALSDAAAVTVPTSPRC